MRPSIRNRHLRLQRQTRGYTLTEMLMAVGVVVVLAALCVPSFRAFTTSQQIRTVAYDLYGDVLFARSEAIKRNAGTSVARIGGSWSKGWNVIDADGNVIRSHPIAAGTLGVAGPAAAVQFAQDGRQPEGAAIVSVTITDSSGATTALRTVSLDPSGRPRMSS